MSEHKTERSAAAGYGELIRAALEMRGKAYSPYSGFCVGAALLGKSGRVYTGCNVENASYPVGICAERAAFAKAVSEGEREFSALAVAGAARGSKSIGLCPPCGMCRQFIREFCSGDFPVILAETDVNGSILRQRICTLDELLPLSFGPDELRSGEQDK